LANRLPVETDRYVLLHCALRVTRIAQDSSCQRRHALD
jgi:hypothetical protein